MSQAQAPSFEWEARFGGERNDLPTHMAVDRNTNIYITGTFQTNATFGGIILTNRSTDAYGWSIFVSKLDRNGNVLWARGFGTFANEFCCGFLTPLVAVDDRGNVYVASPFREVLSIDGFTLRATNSIDVFLAKFDSNGTVLWLQEGGSQSAIDNVLGLIVDQAGNAVISGYFSKTAIFGGT